MLAAKPIRSVPLWPSEGSPAEFDAESGSRWMFLALCCFVLAQAYTIPLLPLGPSWAVWPTLPDVAAGLLAVTALFSRGVRSGDGRRIWLALLLVFAGCTLTYLWWMVLDVRAFVNEPSVFLIGLFQVYRVAQLVIVFWAVSKIPLSPARLRTISRLAAVALGVVSFSVIFTYFGVIPLSSLAPQIPADQGVAGPWAWYHVRGQVGWGTIGYNHGFVGLQLIMLLMLRLHTRGSTSGVFDGALILLTLTATLFSGSRASLAMMLLFAALMVFGRPRYVLALATPVLVLLLTVSGSGLRSQPEIERIIERQVTVFSPHQVENLSQRDRIWEARLEALAENPLPLLTGGGFGSAQKHGGYNAHMLLLHILTELGLPGLLLFCFATYKGLSLLYRRERGAKPLFWGTVALLFSSLTQETFYPVSAFGTFLSFYFASIAIALHHPIGGRAAPAPREPALPDFLRIRADRPAALPRSPA
jgi:hypothetical protein